jgi:hypothetical protein
MFPSHSDRLHIRVSGLVTLRARGAMKSCLTRFRPQVAFREQSVAFREHSVGSGEHSVAFGEHSVAFRQQSVAFRELYVHVQIAFKDHSGNVQ